MLSPCPETVYQLQWEHPLKLFQYLGAFRSLLQKINSRFSIRQQRYDTFLTGQECTCLRHNVDISNSYTFDCGRCGHRREETSRAASNQKDCRQTRGNEFIEYLHVVQCGASRTNLSVEAMMRLQFGVGWLCCEDSTGDCKSENHDIII